MTDLRALASSVVITTCLAAAGCADQPAPGALGPGPGSDDPPLGLAGLVTTSFQDGVSPTTGYSGTRDTFFEQDAPTTTHGGASKLSVSGDTPSGSGRDDVALVQWELAAAIPTTAVVRGASITLTVSDKADQTYALFEVLRAWDEGSATWRRATSSVNWATAGAAGASDRGAAVLGTLRAASTGVFTIPLTAAGVAAVQRWVANPSTNHGVILAGAGNDNRLEFQSSEDSKSGRPRLAVTWEPGGGDGTLDPTPGSYRRTCDGSGAIALDLFHFLDFSDEDQAARVYTRATSADPLQAIDVSAALELASDDEADLEEAARVGDRVYAITSHGRNKDGELEDARHRFAAFDLSGAAPSLSLAPVASTEFLLEDLLDASSWDHPDAAVLSALAAATQLSRAVDPDLAPEVHGFNLEGLASYPSPDNPERLLLGLRNPHTAGGRAILVTLLNPSATSSGAFAHFGEVIALDLGGLGVRSLAWSAAHDAMLVIAGPIGDGGATRLYKWSGDPAAAPVFVADVVGPGGTAAEAIVPYPGTKDVQILFDQGGQLIGGTECKKLAAGAQAFTDRIIHVD